MRKIPQLTSQIRISISANEGAGSGEEKLKQLFLCKVMFNRSFTFSLFEAGKSPDLFTYKHLKSTYFRQLEMFARRVMMPFQVLASRPKRLLEQ